MNKTNFTLVGFFQNFNITAGQMIIHALTVMLYAIPYKFLFQYKQIDISVSVINIFLVFLSVDFINYWFHRLSHKVHCLWGIHLVHHADNDYNLTTGGRTPWFKTLAIFPCYLIFAVIGVQFETFVFILLLTHLTQFWVHTSIIPRIPLMDYILVNPSFHRVHHGTQDIYMDKNFSEVFPYWDHLFGTYVKEEKDEPPKFGLQSLTNINRPIVQNIYYFISLYKLSKISKNKWDKYLIYFKGLNYSPSNISGLEQDEIKKLLIGEAKFNMPSSKRLIWLLFIPVYLGTGAFFILNGKVSGVTIFAITAFVLIAMEIQGMAINKKLD